VVDQGLQHPNLQHAAVSPRLHRRGLQPVEKAEQRSDVLIGPMLGEQQPGQSQVLVLTQIVRLIIDSDRSILGPSGRR